MAIRNLNSKKAYVHTIEAFIAFFITFIFVIYIISKGVSPKAEQPALNILDSLEQRDDFRDCVYAVNLTCAENIISSYVPSTYNFKVSIGAPEPFKGSKDIYTETLFMVGNQTNNYKIVYLYYWLKSG
jgi:hypothetical protein